MSSFDASSLDASPGSWSGDGLDDFGQKIDLTVRIREILRNYPEGLSILKELLQNADDAGARVVKFVLADGDRDAADGKGDGHRSDVTPLSRATCGPSLLAYNDAVFTETDFKSIQRIGDSLKKEGEGNKTGRFGVGVNSVYHLTEVPMFTSGNKVVLFDPQAAFVPGINPANPGKMVDVSTKNGADLIKSLPAVFSPLKCFGCNLNSNFKGTIFRFALRTEEQAKVSRLSRQFHTLEMISDLLEKLQQESTSMLLFLKHIENIEIYRWPVGAPEPVLLHSTSVNNPTSSLRKKRAFVLTASLLGSAQPNDYAMELVSSSNGSRPEMWVVCNQLGGGVATAMAFDEKLKHMKLVPWAGVAARISPAEPKPEGAAYCFLPLPVKTDLPVHVNGYFELSSNRRDVWWGDDMAGDGKARADWNLALIRDIAAPSYCRLVEHCVKSSHVTTSSYENLFPTAQKKGGALWEILATAFYEHAATKEILYSLSTSRWVAPTNAILVHDPENVALTTILCQEPSLPIVQFSTDDLRKCLLERKVCRITTTTDFVRSYYSSNLAAKHPSLQGGQSTANAKVLLSYVISDFDAVTPANCAKLANLPFVPLSDGSLGRLAILPPVNPSSLSQLVSMGFSSLLSLHALRQHKGNVDAAIEWLFEHRHAASSVITHGLDPYFVCGDEAATLLSPSPHTFIDTATLASDPPALTKLLLNSTFQKTLNVLSFDPSMLGDVVSRAIPLSWRGEECAPWSPSESSLPQKQQVPGVDWFKALWKYMCNNTDSIDCVAEQYCIVPTNEKMVTNLSRGASVVFATTLPPEVKDAILHLSVRTVLCDLIDQTVVVPKAFFRFINEPTREGVIFAIDASVRRTSSKKADLWPQVTPAMRDALYSFLISNPNNSPQLSPAAADMLKTFPIFSAYDDTVGSSATAYVTLSGPNSFKFLSTPPTEVEEKVLTSNLLRCRNSSDAKTLLSLEVASLHRRGLYDSVILPRLVEFSLPLLNDIMSAFLVDLPSFCREDANYRNSVAEVNCIPSTDGSLHKPTDLFDPANPQLYVLLDENAFPSEHFRDANLLLSLRLLGLQSTLTFETVIECAKRIEKCAIENATPAHGSSSDPTTLLRARELLSFLDKNTQVFFPEAFASRVEEKKSFFKAISSAIFDDPQAKKAQQQKQLAMTETLKSIRWVPVCCSPPIKYLPWNKEKCTMPVASPLETRCRDSMWLSSYCYRLIDGDVFTHELKTVLGFNEPVSKEAVALQLKMLAVSFEQQKLEILTAGALHSPETELNLLCQAISSEVPRIYNILNQVTSDNETRQIKSALHQSKWLWMGDSFVESEYAAFSSPINATPYLYTVPPDLACFMTLLRIFGVRSKFGSSDFCQVLKRIHEHQRRASTAKQPAHVYDTTDLAVQITQLLSDDVMHITDMEIFAPDACGLLHPTSNLVYDDAPWLSKTMGSRKDLIFVHPKISSNVGERIGVRSLRQMLVNTNSETLDFGVPHEAFGQTESLTRRLRNIIEMYPEGPSILSELIQNSDDAGASTVKVMISRKRHNTSSLLGSKLQPWQGPAIYVYNDARFSDRDFQNLSKVGQASKLDKLVTTGRFGLGFNSVFHWTDVPSFVTGDHLVMFDPHEKYVPGATSTSRGIKIKYSGTDLLEQFPDQFRPYCHFGCDMKAPFNGTLFRFPLRDEKTASESEISKTQFDDRKVDELLNTFKSACPRFLLFLRNVRRVEVFLEDEGVGDSEPRLLYFADVASRKGIDSDTDGKGASQLRKKSTFDLFKSPASPLKPSTTLASRSGNEVSDFIMGPPDRPLSKEGFYSKLIQTPDHELPSTRQLVTILYSDLTVSSLAGGAPSTITDEYLVCVALGGGRCKLMACDEKFRHMKFIPWGGVAAHLQRNGEFAPRLVGNAFCFLPLPAETGLPVHVNGYFELSANRRDIWIGQDMTGEGRVRSDWNELLLSDVIGPLYARLLHCVASLVGSGSRYFDLWPTTENNQPWRIVTRSLYKTVQSLPLFPSRSLASFESGGANDDKAFGLEKWVAPNDSVVVESSPSAIDNSNTALAREELKRRERSTKLALVLLKEQLNVVVLPLALITMLKANECAFVHATPTFVRNHFKRSDIPHPGSKARGDALFLLKYAAMDVPGDDFSVLNDLPFLPLADDSLGSFGTLKYTANSAELELLKAARNQIVDTNCGDEELNTLLKSEALHRHTNLHTIDRIKLLSLLSFVFPSEWGHLDEVSWDSRIIEEGWVRKFWSYSVSQQSADDTGNGVDSIRHYLENLHGTFCVVPCLVASNDFGNRKVLVKLKDGLPVLSPTFATIGGGSSASSSSSSTSLSTLTSVVSATVQKIGVRVLDVDIFDASTMNTVVTSLTHLRTIRNNDDADTTVSAQARYVQVPTTAGVLRAISNMFPKRIDSLDLARRCGSRFSSVTPHERDALRNFLRDPFNLSAEEITVDLAETLMALPIFPVFQRTNSATGKQDANAVTHLDLLTDTRWIAPNDVEDGMLDSRFLNVDRRDIPLLEQVGVGVMDAKHFYLNHALPRINENSVAVEVRDKTVRKLLRDFPGLVSERGGSGRVGNALLSGDDEFKSKMSCFAFVPNRKGSLISPDNLYDPTVAGMTDLLGDESFPSPAFCSADILSSLRDLGMRTVLSCRGVVESAKSAAAEALSGDKRDSAAFDAAVSAARKRGACLLKFVDAHIETLLQQCRDDDHDNLGNPPNLSPCFLDSTIEGRFIEELVATKWLPVKSISEPAVLSGDQPHLAPPKNSATAALAAPVDVRSADDSWLCSSSKYILDGVVTSELLRKCFQWDRPVDVKAVALQLLALSAMASDRSNVTPAFRQNMASVIPRMYTILDSSIQSLKQSDGASQQISEVSGILHKRKWLWVGDNFVSSDRVAMTAPSNARPHLFSVPTELECFSDMLSHFGVRPSFTGSDYLRVNEDLFKLSSGGSLSLSDTELAIGITKLLADLPKPDLDESIRLTGCSVYLPTQNGTLRKADEMVYDDAPWLSASLAGRMNLKFVHPQVGEAAAVSLGAKSLREVLLANQSGMQTIPCPTAESLKQLLGGRTKERKRQVAGSSTSQSLSHIQDSRVLLDLFEVGETAGVSHTSVVMDWNSHGEESLLHPGLGVCQGPSIFVCFHDIVLGVDELVRLSAPSMFYRSSTLKCEGGMPRFGSGLCSLYQLCDSLQVLSGNQLHLFDPCGNVLFSGQGEGDGANASAAAASALAASSSKKGKVGQPIARRYGLSHDDMFVNFKDQFFPFVALPFGIKESFQGGAPGKSAPGFFKGTVFKICFRTKPSAISQRVFSPKDISLIVKDFEKRAPTCFLFTKNLRAINLDQWPVGPDRPPVPIFRTRLRTSPSVRNSYVEQLENNSDWKKSLFSLFKSYTPVKTTHTVEISHKHAQDNAATTAAPYDIAASFDDGIEEQQRQLEGGGALSDDAVASERPTKVTYEEVVDTYMISSVLAPAGIREMVSSDSFKRLNLSPLIRMAAHINRSVSGSFTPFKVHSGTVFVGFDTGIKTGLPLIINAPFFLHEFNRSVLLEPNDDMDVRTVYPKIRQLESSGGGPIRSASLWEWNREVLSSAMSELIPELLREMRDPLKHLYSRNAKLIYKYWPRFQKIKPRFQTFVTPLVYSSLAKSDLYLTHRNGFQPVTEGVFETAEFPLSKRAGEFFLRLFPMFNVPGIVSKDIQLSGFDTKQLTPSMARRFLKSMGGGASSGANSLSAIIGRDEDLAIEILTFCLMDTKTATGADDAASSATRKLRWEELIGLTLIPLVDGTLGSIGRRGLPILIASREQQQLLPNLSNSFVARQCLVKLKSWFDNVEFLAALKLDSFSPVVLAKHMESVLPRSWSGKDFVPFLNKAQGGVAVHDTKGPSPLWLKLFWSEVGIWDHEKVALFNRWPLIPTTAGELASCSNSRFVLALSPRVVDISMKRTLTIDHTLLKEAIAKEEANIQAASVFRGAEGGETSGLYAGPNGENRGDAGRADFADLYDSDASDIDDTIEDEANKAATSPTDAPGQMVASASASGGGGGATGGGSNTDADEDDEVFDALGDQPPSLGPISAVATPMSVMPPPPPNLSALQQQQQQQQQQQMVSSAGIRALSGLLAKLRAPVLELAYFSEMDVQSVIGSNSDRSAVSRKVLVTLSHCINFWPTAVAADGLSLEPRLRWQQLEPDESDELLHSLAMDDQKQRLNLLPSDLDKLRELPVFETLAGNRVSLSSRESHFTLDSSLDYSALSVFLPENAKMKFLREKQEVVTLYKDMGVDRLSEPKLFSRFVLPDFANMPLQHKEAVLGHVKSRYWTNLQMDEEFKAKLGKTPFVKRYMRAAQLGGTEFALPEDVYDPRHELLSVIFDDEPSVFPAEDFATDEWLKILVEVGLKKNVDKDIFLKCAKRVESARAVAKSMTLHGYLNEHFAEFYDPQFARSLGEIVCVPGIDDASQQLVLKRFRDVIVPKDRHLGFSVMPVIPDLASPPQVMFSALGVVSPPRIEVVLSHLRNLTVNGGQLDRWTYRDDAVTVFQSLYKYLEDNFERIGPRVQAGLRDLAMVPIGMTLIKASRLFFRLSHDLAPFMYEVPRAFGAYDKFLRELGVRAQPTIDDYCNCLSELKTELGESRLNANELQAVCKLLKLMGEDENNKDYDVSASGPLYGVDERSVLTNMNELVYNDAPWLIAGGRLNRRLIRLVHPKLRVETVEGLGIRKLSACLVELLERNFALKEVERIGGGVLECGRLEATLRSEEFRDAVENLKRAGHSTASSTTAATLDLRHIKLRYVESLRTRFVLLEKGSNSTGVDCTASAVGTLCFVDKRTGDIHIALSLLPSSVPPQLVLAMNLCDLIELRRENVGIVSAMLASDPAEIGNVCTALRVKGRREGAAGATIEAGAPSKKRDDVSPSVFEEDDELGRGVAGNRVCGADSELVELRPVRAFGVGELVAFKDGPEEDEKTALRYGVVMAVNNSSGSSSLKMIRVDMGCGQSEDMISSKVYSFMSGKSGCLRSGKVGGGDPSQEAVRVNIGDLDVGGASSLLTMVNVDSGAAAGGGTAAQTKPRGPVSSVNKEQMLEAVEDILRSAQMTLTTDAKTLMAENARMREESQRRERHVQAVTQRVKDVAADIEKINEAFLCPITREIMEDPVISMDGHSYERDAIERWLESHDTSPKTNARLPSRFLVPNHALRSEIEATKSAKQQLSHFLQGL